MQTENAHRLKARLLVSLFPGIHLRELQRLLGISFSSTRYHVDVLRRTGQVQRVEEGGYSRLYPPGTNDENRALFSSLRSPTKRTMLQTLTQRPNLTQKQLWELTGLARSTISETLSTLLSTQIIETSLTQSGATFYRVRDPETVRMVLGSGSTALEKAVDRFIDLWDM